MFHKEEPSNTKTVVAYPHVGTESGPHLWGQELVRKYDQERWGRTDVTVRRMASQLRAGWPVLGGRFFDSHGNAIGSFPSHIKPLLCIHTYMLVDIVAMHASCDHIFHLCII
jgi:hypothetical protein